MSCERMSRSCVDRSSFLVFTDQSLVSGPSFRDSQSNSHQEVLNPLSTRSLIRFDSFSASHWTKLKPDWEKIPSIQTFITYGHVCLCDNVGKLKEIINVRMRTSASSEVVVEKCKNIDQLQYNLDLGLRNSWLARKALVNSVYSRVALLMEGVHGATFVPLLQVIGASTSRLGVQLTESMLPLKVASFSSFTTLEQATHVGLFSLTSAIMFIGSIRGLSKHSTAQEGNILGMVATALGILSVLVSPGFHGAHVRFFTAFTAAALTGYCVAMNVNMEDMPQLVAGFHSFVGLAAVFAGFASYMDPVGMGTVKALETCIGVAIGSLTFTGSVVAAGKLHGLIPGRPIILDNRWTLNIIGVLSNLFLAAIFAQPHVNPAVGLGCLVGSTAISGFLGVNMVLPIGGADMPVVVSLLNAFSGLATSAAGFMLSNNLLTITGALVASSGTLLSEIMCRGINRSMCNVLLGGFGTDGTLASAPQAGGGPVTEVSATGFVGMLLNAKRVVIVPGYGLAVARCQQRLADMVTLLRSRGVQVHFAIHPVAGRLPGHMNVLLAEANVPYDIVREMDDISKELPHYDVALVVGANDIVNPATKDDPGSPIYGMPVIGVWECKTCVVLKRSMATGYSGVDNPLFCRPNVRMLFGDARQSIDMVHNLLEQSKDQISPGAGMTSTFEPEPQVEIQAEVNYPEASRSIGILRERHAGERRVSIPPSAVPSLRMMGFSVLLEAGAGANAGFTDEAYVKHGGVRVADSAEEVLKQANIVLKVTAPLPDEVHILQANQTIVGFWNMYNTDDLTETLRKSMASFINLSLIPRVSRAQQLDALTSMANVAGYRAVLDAFSHLPRFSRSSVTASGAVPPAKVFVIGAGVAGLSAIATAHSLGAKVYANDVRDAAREQVESMGAEFIPVDAQGIAGEGVGGYAADMGEAFRSAQLRTYARVIKDMDVVITTAMIPNRAAPQVITHEMVESMRRGSVIVDLAVQTGGNCTLTRKDAIEVTPAGVTIIGETNYPSAMPEQASEMLGKNFIALLEILVKGSGWDDPIIQAATIVHQGQAYWPQAQAGSSGSQSHAGATTQGAPLQAEVGETSQPTSGQEQASPNMPPEVKSLLEWLKEHESELALGLGAAVVLGTGMVIDIPETELAHIGYFVLSCLIGHFTVAGVTPALHTPLISVTNAISGIIVVGGMLQLSGPLASARVACALASVFLSSVNIVGGFAVTHRMLEMFRKDR